MGANARGTPRTAAVLGTGRGDTRRACARGKLATSTGRGKFAQRSEAHARRGKNLTAVTRTEFCAAGACPKAEGVNTPVNTGRRGRVVRSALRRTR